MKSFASRDLSKVNDFLKENDIQARLKRRFSDDFKVASIFNIVVTCPSEAVRSKIYCHDKEYPAIKMNGGFRVYKKIFCRYGAEPYIYPNNIEAYIVTIKTNNGDIIYISGINILRWKDYICLTKSNR